MRPKIHLLPLGPSCPLQTILLSDLVWYDSPLQIVMVVWRALKKCKASQLAMIVCYRLPHPTQQVKIPTKVRQMASVICRGLLYLYGWASENISRRFFKGRETLRGQYISFISDEYERVNKLIVTV